MNDPYFKTPEERLAKLLKEETFERELRQDYYNQQDRMPDGSDQQGWDINEQEYEED